MKKLALILIIGICSFKSQKETDYICCEYVGPSDKPLIDVFISKEPVQYSDSVTNFKYEISDIDYIVTRDEYEFIKKTINSTQHKIFQNNNYNGFKIRICENHALIFYAITRKNSNEMFLKFNTYLGQHAERNKKLIQAITYLKTSNVFEGD